ncbi:hypothetical protein BDF19DRAFT_411996 [Syncephalis fuscata]|nr:hypothetical protein BDF19DRAFT_411996 [Syncephalis fuscata]
MLPKAIEEELGVLQTEYGHGIQGEFTIANNSQEEYGPHKQSFIQFTTIEDTCLVMALSDRGYKIVSAWNTKNDNDTASHKFVNELFESMDSLLSTISAGYRFSFQNKLHAQLEALSNATE